MSGLSSEEEERAAHCRLQQLPERGRGQRREEESLGRVKHLTVICPSGNAGIKCSTVSVILTCFQASNQADSLAVNCDSTKLLLNWQMKIKKMNS